MSSLSLAVQLRATASLPSSPTRRRFCHFLLLYLIRLPCQILLASAGRHIQIPRGKERARKKGKSQTKELALLPSTSLRGQRPRLRMGSHSASLSTEADAGTRRRSSRGKGARKAFTNAGYAFAIVLPQSVRTLTDSCRARSQPLLPRRDLCPRWTPAAMLNLPQPKPSHLNS